MSETTKKKLEEIDALRMENIQLRYENVALKQGELQRAFQANQVEGQEIGKTLTDMRGEYAAKYGFKPETLKIHRDGTVEGEPIESGTSIHTVADA